ncbi:MAG: hypothetical protein HYS19_03585 [Nitrosomonadales bacterium]|nr:hypothetical protein [Nitrosomonadales bacterium]
MSLLITPQPLQHLPAALSFPLFFLQFIRFTQCCLPQWFGGGIRICRNFSRAGLMCRRVRGERRAEKNRRSASAGVMFSNFLGAGEEMLWHRSIYGASFQQTLGCA